MTFDLLDLAIKVGTFMISIAAMVVAWFASRSKHVDTRIEAGAKRLDDLDRRTQTLEQVIQTLPGKDDLHSLEIGMTKISGQLDVMTEAMSGHREIMKRLETIVSRHEDHLLEGKR
ncbi:MAG: DUF2730 family protein [Rhodobacteraceae bacterium]|nr:DUF2730 family protein [Paracoccaceae bacterium]